MVLKCVGIDPNELHEFLILQITLNSFPLVSHTVRNSVGKPVFASAHEIIFWLIIHLQQRYEFQYLVAECLHAVVYNSGCRFFGLLSVLGSNKFCLQNIEMFHTAIHLLYVVAT